MAPDIAMMQKVTRDMLQRALPDDSGRRSFLLNALLADSLGLVGLNQTVLTNGLGAYVSVATERDRSTRYRRGCQLSDGEREEFWNAVSLRADVRTPAKSTPVLTLRSLEVKDYPGGPAIVLVYEQEDDAMGPQLWTLVRFFSGSFAVSFKHQTAVTDPVNGLDGFDAMMRSFRFGK